MKKVLILLTCFVILFTACKKSHKEDPQPEPDAVLVNPAMEYKELSNLSIGEGESLFFDFDQNGRKDLIFRTENHAYDGNTKSRIVYIADSTPYCHLAIEPSADYTIRLNTKEAITVADLKGYNWYNANSPYLMSKIYANNTTYWEGGFKEAGKGFLPFHFTTGGKRYLGWMEISTNLITGRMYFHRVAISKEPVEKIYAGM